MNKLPVGLADLVRVLGIADSQEREIAVAAIAERRREEVRGLDDLSMRLVDLEANDAPVDDMTTAPAATAPVLLWAPTGFEWRTQTPTPTAPQRTPPEREPSPPPEMPLLAERAEVLALIRERLQQDAPSDEPDVDRVIERVSRCEYADPMPMRKRRRWGNRVTFAQDWSERLTPFRVDQELICDWIAEWYPHDNVTTLRNVERSPTFFFGETNASRFEAPPDTLVIALTDFGLLADGGADIEQFWVEWGRRIRDAGSRTLALVPTVVPDGSPLRENWTVIPWGVTGNPVPASSEALETLLTMASPAVRLEAGLLRELRLLRPELRDDPGWEARVWQHDAFFGRAPEGATFHAQQQASLLRNFARLPQDLRRDTLAAIIRWHDGYDPLLLALTTLSLDEDSKRLLPKDEVARASERVVTFGQSLDRETSDVADLAFGSSVTQRIHSRPANDPALVQALNLIDRAVRDKTDDAQSNNVEPWYDPRDPATPAGAAETMIEIREIGNRLEFAPLPSGPSFPVEPRPGSLLTIIRSRNYELVLGDVDRRHDPFWASGKAPAWASAWGVDEYGRWAEFAYGGATQRMRWIEPGTFRMGSPPDEEGRWADEGPVHEVTITRGYWLFETPCCQDLWNAVGLAANPSAFSGERRPVERVTWDEAVGFLDRLSEAVTGLELRLPREAEWEYACRAGTSTARYGELETIAWIGANSDGTHDVGQKQANGWGLHDMLGNVWEWCLDDKRNYSTNSVVDPDGGRGSDRVVRGGSWGNQTRSVRAASRYWYRPDDLRGNLGFRALSSGASPAPGGRVRIGYLRRAEPDARGSAPEAPKKKRIPVHGLTTAELPRRREFALQSDVETCVFERIAKPSWARDFGRDRYGLWCTLEIGDVVQRMRWIPPGRFLMGSPPEEEGRYKDEGPMHPVVLTSGYWLFDTPCTQALWSAVMNGDNPSHFRDPLRPVENVSHKSVEEFLKAINRTVGGLSLTLPTEAQWEYACRAGTTTATYAGDLKIRGRHDAPVLNAIAWYGGNSGHEYDLEEGYYSSDWREKQYQHTKAGTRRVATKHANGWGLYDMLGNVWEWCIDSRRGYTDDVAADSDEGRGSERVVRGGSWFDVARRVRASHRRWFRPVDRNSYLGFRALT